MQRRAAPALACPLSCFWPTLQGNEALRCRARVAPPPWPCWSLQSLGHTCPGPGQWPLQGSCGLGPWRPGASIAPCLIPGLASQPEQQADLAGGWLFPGGQPGSAWALSLAAGWSCLGTLAAQRARADRARTTLALPPVSHMNSRAWRGFYPDWGPLTVLRVETASFCFETGSCALGGPLGLSGRP